MDLYVFHLCHANIHEIILSYTILYYTHWRIQDLKLGGGGSESDKPKKRLASSLSEGVSFFQGGRLRLNLTSKKK